MNKQELLQEFEKQFLNKRGSLRPLFYKNKYTNVYKDHQHLAHQLLLSTILLPSNATYSERYYALKNNIIFRPKCMYCGNEVRFDRGSKQYKKFCSDACGNKYRAKYFVYTDEIKQKIGEKSKQSMRKRNTNMLESEWKPTILEKHKHLDFSKYDWQPYVNSKSIIICPKHGEQEASIGYLLGSKYGCPECGREAKGVEYGKRKSEEKKNEFFEWLEKNRPQSITENTYKQYVDFGTKIEFNCSVHGLFYATPSYMEHSEYDCPKCGRETGARKSHINTSVAKHYIENKFPEFKIIYLEYDHIRNKNIILECPKHGVFTTSYELIKGSEYCCSGCAKEIFSDKRAYDKDEAINLLKLKHPHIDFSKFEYRRSNTESTIICPKHGEVNTTFNYMIGSDYGCPKCGRSIRRSIGEIETQTYVESLGIIVEPSHIIKNNIRNIELDIFVPTHNFAIEYNGVYHHNMQSGRGKGYHSHKTTICRENNIFLFHIFDYQWDDKNKQSIIKSMIKSKLGLIENKIYGRKCEIVEITDSKFKNQFYDENHIQGRCNSSYNIALTYNDEIVSLMSFSYNKKKDEWDLIRFANKKETSVVGGFSKLLRYFERNKHPKRIITFADLMYSYGDVYLKNGFNKDYELEEGYFYFYKGKRYHRSSFMKNKIKEKFDLSEEYVESKTETELINELGILRIYDSGKIKFSKDF